MLQKPMRLLFRPHIDSLRKTDRDRERENGMGIGPGRGQMESNTIRLLPSSTFHSAKYDVHTLYWRIECVTRFQYLFIILRPLKEI